MKKFLIALLVILVFSLSLTAWADVWVNGYTRSNGTYVQGHYRSDPNNTVTDNYSFYGNRNPHTGAIGSNRYYSAPSSPYYNPFRSYVSPYPSYNSYGYSSPYGYTAPYTFPYSYTPPALTTRSGLPPVTVTTPSGIRQYDPRYGPLY